MTRGGAEPAPGEVGAPAGDGDGAEPAPGEVGAPAGDGAAAGRPAPDVPPPPAPPPAPPPRPRRRLARGAATCAAGLLAGGAALWATGLAWTLASRTPCPPDARGPAPLPADVAARFAYPEHGTAPIVTHTFGEEQGLGWRSRWLWLTATTPGDEAPHRVQVIAFSPEPAPPGRRAAVLVSPILGGGNEVAKLIARSLARRGLEAAVVLRAEGYLASNEPPARFERVLRTAVVDRRRALDWLCHRDDVDPARLGAIGVSMGGIATAILAAVEPRVRASVLALSGGPIADVVVSSGQRRVVRYVAEAGARGTPPAALRDALRRAVVSDPVALAPHVDPRRVLVIGTRFDDCVPTPWQARLLDALGRPEHEWLPVGHHPAAVYAPYLLARAGGWLEARLAPGSPE